MWRFAVPTVIAIALGACATRPAPSLTSVTIEQPDPRADEWRRAIVESDLKTIEDLTRQWVNAQTQLDKRERGEAAAEGALLDPAGALTHPALPPGSYNCRVVRIGSLAGRGGLRAFPSQFCFVNGAEDGKLTLDKQTGSDLPTGWLYPDGDKRYVFLGAQQRKPGENSIRYGVERDRDLAGVVERVGPFRWRLVIPRSDPDGLWIYELTPVPAERQPGADTATKVGSARAIRRKA